MVWFRLTGLCKGVILLTNVKSLQEIREKGKYLNLSIIFLNNSNNV